MADVNPCHVNRDELLLGGEGCWLWTYVRVERQGKDQVPKRGKSISGTVGLSVRDSCLYQPGELPACDLVTEIWPFLLDYCLCCVLMNCPPHEATQRLLFFSPPLALALAAAGLLYLMRFY